MSYQKILVAVSLDVEHDKLVLQKALQLVDNDPQKLNLVHAVEHINAFGAASAYHAIADIEDQITEEHKEQLDNLAKYYNITNKQIFIAMGNAADVVNELAQKLQADLIVAGSHVHHGLQLLLGSSTCDSILHHTQCDILAVKLPE